MMTEPTSIEFWCESGGRHPVVGAVWFRMSIARGLDSERYSRYLCTALSMMAYRASDCDAMIKLLDCVANGNSQEEGYGLNDTYVIFRLHGVQVGILIEDELEPAAGRFGLTEYRKVLCAWRAFLLLPEAKESKIRLELS